jgi:hypothetical protein
MLGVIFGSNHTQVRRNSVVERISFEQVTTDATE